AVDTRLVGKRSILGARKRVAPLSRGRRCGSRRSQPFSELAPSLDSTLGERRYELAPNECHGFDVTKTSARRIDAVAQVARQRAKRAARQVGIQPAGHGMDAYRVERKARLGFEAARPITQERELEPREMDRSRHSCDKAGGLAQAFPSV